jgi:hypothetical protein
MTTKSDTPRTDAKEKLFFSSINGLPDPTRNYVPIDFARTLERENVIFLESATKSQIRARELEVAAAAVVAARYCQGDDAWDKLKNAICELEGLVKP